MEDLKNKTVLITGTNRGIGKVILEEFAKCGANVIAHSRKETPEFVEYINSIAKTYGVTVTPVYFDMTDSSKMKEELQNIIKSKHNLYALVNSAGIISSGLFQMTSISTIKNVFDVNLFSQMELTQLVLKKFLKQKSGNIINIGSVGGLDAEAGSTAYGSSKAAFMCWTKILAQEYGQLGIRANVVAPSLTKTNMIDKINIVVQDEIINNNGLKRIAQPSEIAKVVVFLASEQSSFVNGQIIRVDGGKI